MTDKEDQGYVCLLDKTALEKAKKELKEDPKDRLHAVQALRTWIKDQPHLKCNTDTLTLLSFLRTAKFSELKARQMVDGFCTVSCQNRDWFKDIDPLEEGIQAVLNTGHILPLKNRDKNGSQIIIYRIGVLNPKNPLHSIKYQLRAANCMGAIYAQDEATMVNGFVFVFDMSNITAKHMGMWKLDDMKRWFSAWQGNFPGRYKGLHYYNAGTFFDAMMALARPLFNKKMSERIRTHDNLESLYKYIPQECLPEDYLPDDYSGPCAGSVQECLDNFKNQLETPEVREALRKETSDEVIFVDESKRPKEKLQATFRKLNVD